MTASERAKMRKLELENDELRARVAQDAEVWRDQALELIDLRARLELLGRLLGRVSLENSYKDTAQIPKTN